MHYKMETLIHTITLASPETQRRVIDDFEKESNLRGSEI